MLNWWEANQFRMPSTPKAQRYMPSLLDYPSSSGTSADGNNGDQSPSGLGIYGGAGGRDEIGLQDSPSADLSRSGGGLSHKSVGSGIGSVLGIAAGVPGIGLLGSIAGAMSDASRANQDMEAVGRAPSLSGAKDFVGSAPFGLGLGEKIGLGQTYDKQIADEFGFNLGRSGLAALANAAKGLDATAYGIEQEGAFRGPDTGAGLGGISPGAGGYMSSLPDGTVAGFGALGTPSGGGGPSAPASGDGPGGMTGDAGDPGADGGPSGPWNRGGVLPKRRDTVSGPDDQLITAKSGEGIIRAEAVEHYGPGLIGAINRMKIPKKELQGLLGVRA